MHYIRHHAGKKNRAINSRFWEKNYCILPNLIDYKSFPTLKIGIESLQTHLPQLLSLPPEIYISNAGCPKGHVRLIFRQEPQKPPHFFSAIRIQLSKTELSSTPDMIIGTTLLENYAIKIHFTANPTVDFYDSKKLCHSAPYSDRFEH
jgi:hypothetical protein